MDNQRATIEIVGDDDALRRRLSTALEAAGARVVDGEAEADAVVVAGAAAAAAATLDRGADAELPTDCGDDELRRTASLLVKLAEARCALRRANRQESEWAKLAATDPLTELPNRRAWDEALAATASRSRGDDRPLCVAVVDLDRFKSVNDEHGHGVGDEVLRAVARALRSAIRQGDFAARLGGDEFGLLLPGLTADRAGDVLERIRLACDNAAAGQFGQAATCSVGFAVGSVGGQSELLKQADDALRRAKQGGRSRTSA